MAALPPYSEAPVTQQNGQMSLPMRQNDEDIKNKIAELEALIADHEARLVAGGL